MQLRVGNGASVAVGDLDLHLPSGLVLELSSVYYVPSISRNIISVSCMDMDGFTFSIKDQYFSFYRDGIFYGSSQVVNDLYVLEMDNQVLNINNKRLKSSRESETFIWHHRLGHINETRIKKLQEVGLLGCFDLESITTCESCLSGKMTKAHFTKKSERSKDLLGLVHSDVCGPMSISARDGSRYFVTFTDDFSRYGYVYLMRHKSESFEKFKEFKAEVENQLGKKTKVFRTDRGGEYLSGEFRGYLMAHGIVSQLTPPGTPQWNGISERRNRTLLDMVRSMMSKAELSRSFWGFALETVAFMLNRVPSNSVEKIPYEL
jgi:GAG-pre-integrase domain/Integrase core domain